MLPVVSFAINPYEEISGAAYYRYAIRTLFIFLMDYKTREFSSGKYIYTNFFILVSYRNGKL